MAGYAWIQDSGIVRADDEMTYLSVELRDATSLIKVVAPDVVPNNAVLDCSRSIGQSIALGWQIPGSCLPCNFSTREPMQKLRLRFIDGTAILGARG